MQKQRDLKEEVKSCENAMALFVNTLNKVSLKLIQLLYFGLSKYKLLKTRYYRPIKVFNRYWYISTIVNSR